MNNIILIDCYNTDYIYSLVISLFHNPISNIYNIINNDTKNSNVFYIQEYIKYYFGSIITNNRSIDSYIICKFRLFLYNCGWLQQKGHEILYKPLIIDFYNFLIYDTLEYSLKFINTSNDNELEFKIINLTYDNIDNKTSNVSMLSCMVDNWIEKNVGDNYKFATMPYFIPIYIDMLDPYTKLNKQYINIMYGLIFKNVCDNYQNTLTWRIYSLICQTSTQKYYSVVNYDNKWIGYSDDRIPSNWELNMSDVHTVKKIMKEVKIIFYSL